MVDEVLLVELEGVFGANVLELPPVVLVELVDLVLLVSPFDEMTVHILLCVEDLNDIFDPWSDFANFVEARSNPRVVHHVEDLEDQDHHLHLVWILTICTDFTKHLFQNANEVVS